MSNNRFNHWGWGRPDFKHNREDLLEIASLIDEFLDFGDLSISDPISVDEISLEKSRIEPKSELRDFITNNRWDRITHTFGKAYRDLVRGFRGEYSNPPDLVAYPENENDIKEIIDWSISNDFKVIPFGGGTSVVGGVEPELPEGKSGPVLSLDLRELDQVLEIDSHSELARIQAGARGPHLENQLQAKDYTLRHYPQSYEFSTLGGWIATRASGHYATVETRIDDLVNEARMITPSGSMSHANFPSTGAGPDPDSMVCGSEGTLGVITEATMRIREKPRYRARASVHFEDFPDAVSATRELAQSRLNPANCRLLNDAEAFINQVSMTGDNVLVLGFESRIKPMEEDLKTALELCRDHGGHCPQEPHYTDESSSNKDRGQAGDKWKQSFLEGPYLFNALVRLGVIVDTFETSCSWSEFEQLHAEVTSSVKEAMREVAGTGLVTCRLTHLYPDGPAPYYTFLAPSKPGSELSQWAEIKHAASEAVQNHGGTITHHHAVGRVHEPWLENERSDTYMKALSAVKQSLDPDNVMNPGALIADPDKYCGTDT